MIVRFALGGPAALYQYNAWRGASFCFLEEDKQDHAAFVAKLTPQNDLT